MSVDDPIVLDANYRFGPTDRRYIDNQIRALQEAVQTLSDDGVSGTNLVTTDDSVIRAKRYAVADGQVRCLRAVITVASEDNSGDVRGEWEIKACYGRVSGTLAQEYAPVITTLFSVGSPPDPSLTLNGDTDVDLNVTGIVSTRLLWKISEFTL